LIKVYHPVKHLALLASFYMVLHEDCTRLASIGTVRLVMVKATATMKVMS
jgi:hypothetical protein